MGSGRLLKIIKKVKTHLENKKSPVGDNLFSLNQEELERIFGLYKTNPELFKSEITRFVQVLPHNLYSKIKGIVEKEELEVFVVYWYDKPKIRIPIKDEHCEIEGYSWIIPLVTRAIIEETLEKFGYKDVEIEINLIDSIPIFVGMLAHLNKDVNITITTEYDKVIKFIVLGYDSRVDSIKLERKDSSYYRIFGIDFRGGDVFISGAKIEGSIISPTLKLNKCELKNTKIISNNINLTKCMVLNSGINTVSEMKGIVNIEHSKIYESKILTNAIFINKSEVINTIIKAEAHSIKDSKITLYTNILKIEEIANLLNKLPNFKNCKICLKGAEEIFVEPYISKRDLDNYTKKIKTKDKILLF